MIHPMKGIPSLFSLCLKTITLNIMHGYENTQDLLELPTEFLNGFLMTLPPLALQNIYELIGEAATDSTFINKRKRGFSYNFNIAWETLYKLRWPTENIKKKHQFSFTAADHAVEAHESTARVIDWQQLYWEGHLQDCLDAATEQALLPAFDGNIYELEIPDSIMSSIGHTRSGPCHCYEISYHFNKFGCYARFLRLQSVICNEDTSELLRTSKLQALVLRRILSRGHVDGVCKLINQNRETLVSIGLVYCKLSPLDVDMICSSIYGKGTRMHGIQHFSIKSSTFSGSKSSSIPSGLSSFLSSGRSLKLVCFADTHMGPKSAVVIFESLIESTCGLVNLEMSGNLLEGWLSQLSRRYTSYSPFSGLCMSLQSLNVLNLRSNALSTNDVEDLFHVLMNIPNLRSLDLSDNPIGDDGIRRLIPFFVKALTEASYVAEIWLDSCDLSVAGVFELLKSLSMLKGQLKTFSIADNDIGSSVAVPLAKFLGTLRVRDLNIEDIGLGPSGFQELERNMLKETALHCINISKNRGGIQTAHFISRILLQAPYLVSINAGSNLLPPESLVILQDAFRNSIGKLELLDLSGNMSLCSTNNKSIISEFQFKGKPIINLPVLPSSSPYDDDP